MSLRAWLHELSETARARRAARDGRASPRERREPGSRLADADPDTAMQPHRFDLPDTVPGLLRAGERVDPETGEIQTGPDSQASTARRVPRAGGAPAATGAAAAGVAPGEDSRDDDALANTIARDDSPAEAARDADHHVPGERGIASVNRAASLRQRAAGLLTFAVFAGLVLAALGWYYAQHFSNQRAAAAEAAKVAEARAAGESGAIRPIRADPPTPPTPPAAPAPPTGSVVSTVSTAVIGGAPPEPPQPGANTRGLFGMPPSQTNATPPASMTAAAGQAPAGPPPKTPEEIERERKLGGELLVAMGAQAAAAGLGAPVVAAGDTPAAASPFSVAGAAGQGNAPAGGGLANQLRPTPTPAVAAQVLPTRRFLLPKGAFIDCTLETAFDSTVDGMVKCVSATDVRSADGKVVLIERGTMFTGEKKGDPRQGQSRVFVLWNEATTPTGVRINLASPVTDELGRAGMGGHVDTHFWARFGGAIMVSLVDAVARGIVANQSSAGGGNAIILNPQGSRDIIAEVLRGTINIAPTISANQGKRINILVARDVDFRSVYELRALGDTADAHAAGAAQ